MEARADFLPNYLRAVDVDSLRLLCMKNNANTGRFHTYQIIFDGKFWYAWFYSESFDIPKGVKNVK